MSSEKALVSEDVSSTNCVYCDKAENGLWLLTCAAKHRICQLCLPQNIARFGGGDIYKCPKCIKIAEEESSNVWIFADNSNIWIEAMKHAAREKGFKKKQDHRVRIDIGRLTDVVASGREVKKAVLYGSEPPKVDTVWKKINQYDHWQVKTKERSTVTGKEKEVDTELVTDVTEVACNTPSHLRGTIIIISGDRDIYPAVDKALKKRDSGPSWSIEIHVWEHAHGLRARLKGLDRVSCSYLDDHMKKVTFLNRQLLPKSKWLNKYDNCAAMISVKDCNVSKDILRNEEWWAKLESATRWPVEYFQPELNKEKYLILAFRAMQQDDVEKLVRDLDNPPSEDFVLEYVEKCEFYPSFKQRVQRRRGKMVTDEEGWTTVVKRNIPPKTVAEPSSASTCCPKLRVTEPASPLEGGAHIMSDAQKIMCCSGKNCEKGKSCLFGHTPNENRYFECREGEVGNIYRKTKECQSHKYNPPCKHSAEWCNYAHGEKDRWCLYCHTSGHYDYDCENGACSHPRH